MAFHVSSERVDRNVRTLAALTGKSLTNAIDYAVLEQIRRLQPRRPDPTYIEDLLQMAAETRVSLKPGLCSTDDLIGYDEDGLPG